MDITDSLAWIRTRFVLQTMQGSAASVAKYDEIGKGCIFDGGASPQYVL